MFILIVIWPKWGYSELVTFLQIVVSSLFSQKKHTHYVNALLDVCSKIVVFILFLKSKLFTLLFIFLFLFFAICFPWSPLVWLVRPPLSSLSLLMVGRVMVCLSNLSLCFRPWTHHPISWFAYCISYPQSSAKADVEAIACLSPCPCLLLYHCGLGHLHSALLP